ncbi:uncharacterized protein LOC141961795 [Athene noctua]|uniref:uncharacterized protein LOC141961795 n=1 Tax=Athene noctua TaxID=126797 RepID=UPI003EB962EE
MASPYLAVLAEVGPHACAVAAAHEDVLGEEVGARWQKIKAKRPKSQLAESMRAMKLQGLKPVSPHRKARAALRDKEGGRGRVGCAIRNIFQLPSGSQCCGSGSFRGGGKGPGGPFLAAPHTPRRPLPIRATDEPDPAPLQDTLPQLPRKAASGPPPGRLTAGSTNRRAGRRLPANQRARGAGHRSLPGRCPPQWARPPPRRAAPAAAHPRLEPRSASFSQSLQCSWSFSSAGGRGGLAGGRLTAVSLSSAILKRGLGACRAPAPKRAAIGRRAAGHAGTGSLRGQAGAGPRRGRDYSSRRALGAPRGGAPGAGGLGRTAAAARGHPPRRRAAARLPRRPFPCRTAVSAPPPASCPRGRGEPKEGGAGWLGEGPVFPPANRRAGPCAALKPVGGPLKPNTSLSVCQAPSESRMGARSRTGPCDSTSVFKPRLDVVSRVTLPSALLPLP